MCRPAGEPSPTPSPTTSTGRASTRRRPSSQRSSSPPASRIGPDHARPRDRQLRQLHLQPRPVPGRARGRAGRDPKRQGRRGRAPRSRAGPCRDLSRPVHPRAGRRLGGCGPGIPGERHPDPRSLPGTPVDGGGVRRPDGARRAHPRQGRGGRARWPGRPDRTPVAAARRPLPLAGGRPGSARRAGAERFVRGRRDGRAPPRAPRRGRSIPPRVRPDPGGQGHPPELPELMPNDIVTRAIDAVCSGTHLTADHASAVLDEIMEGRSSEVQTGAFLVALRAKGETVAELVGLARTMRRLAAPVDVGRHDLVDTAGTGGGPLTFNISTTAAIVAAGAGCAVAKHGNRSSTSRSGSADLLESLGVRIDLDPPAVARCIDAVGFGFMFAPRHHAAMKHVVPVRKELAVRTIFNFLGPLTNPAGATRQLLGVSDRRYQETIAEALVGLGCERAFVVRGEDGVDEIGLGGPTRVIEVAEGSTEEWFAEPASLGLGVADAEEITGGTPEENAATVTRILAGDDGPPRDVVLVNAGAAIVVGGGAPDLEGGIDRARESIDSGAARGVLDRLVEMTRGLAES